MNITIARKRKQDGATTYTSTDVYKVFNMIQYSRYAVDVEQLRVAYLPEYDDANYHQYDRIPQLFWAQKCRISSKRSKKLNENDENCAKSELENSFPEPQFVQYSGIIAVKVEGLKYEAEIIRIKQESMLLPQTLASYKAPNGRGVVILMLASLPDGTLPTIQLKAALFHAKAYKTAVMCLAPTLSHTITVEEPLLSAKSLLSYDPDMLINKKAIPFIIEQPTEQDIHDLTDARIPQNNLQTSSPASKSIISIHEAFNACRMRAAEATDKKLWRGSPMAAVTRIARECAESGLPEEEVTQQMLWYYYKEAEHEVRSTIRSIYVQFDDLPAFDARMPKKQIMNIRLKEFLTRRYELRYNEVLKTIEYRIRRSFDFRFHEFGKFDKNTIKYEAAVEGIEAFDSEITGLIESNYTPRYNPIKDYLNHLGKWDGKPRIEALARLVPTENENWPRLFRRWFLSMVAHWMGVDQTHSNNTAPILIGKQAYRKSTFCHILLPPELRMFFTDSLDLRTKLEAERCLSRFLLINIDEFDQLNETQFAFVKHLFQKPNVAMRKMYSETISQEPRYASFIGTSNNDEILRDPTGNRRYLCVRVSAPIQVETPIDYRQLYAEAVTIVREGKEPYWFGDAEENILKESNKEFESTHPQEHLFLDLFEVVPTTDKSGDWYKFTDILTSISRHPLYDKKLMGNLNVLGRALTRFNATKKRMADGIHYWLRKR